MDKSGYFRANDSCEDNEEFFCGFCCVGEDVGEEEEEDVVGLLVPDADVDDVDERDG